MEVAIARLQSLSLQLIWLLQLGRICMKYFIGLLVFFVITDGLLTNLLVKDGLAREGNPFLQPLVGDVGFLILKVVGALICAFILWDVYRRSPRVALVCTSCFVVCYGGIVFWNLSLLLLAQI